MDGVDDPLQDDDKPKPTNTFEWLTNFSSLRHLLCPHYLFAHLDSCDLIGEHRQRKVLHMGSGTSTLGENLLEQLGYGLVLNVDTDGEVLDAMKNRWKERQVAQRGRDWIVAKRERQGIAWRAEDKIEDEDMPQQDQVTLGDMRYVQMDFKSESSCRRVLDSIYPAASFDLVVDKSTLDCALCSDDAATGLICESYRALRSDGGVYLVISFHHVDFFLPLLRDCPGAEWDVECHVVRREVDLPAGCSVRRTLGTATLQDNKSERRDWTPKKYQDASEENEKPVVTCESAASPAESAWSSGSFVPTAEYRETVNVFLCRRHSSLQDLSCSVLDRHAVREHIHRTNDSWFKSRNPMVTQTREDDLRRLFTESLRARKIKPGNKFIPDNQPCCNGETLDNSAALPLQDCYNIMFTDEEREHLPYEFFLEDWNAFAKEHLRSSEMRAWDSMTFDAAIQFLNEMQ